MRIAFLQNFWYEYLGVMSIAAVVKQKGHQPQVFINSWEKDLFQTVVQFRPDVIAFPVYSGSQKWVLETAQELKKKLGKLVVLGGPHATFFPEIIKEEGIDIVCRGEGEYPMAELLDALAKKENLEKIANLWIKKGKRIIKNPVRPLISPLDRLPLLDRGLYYRYQILAKNPVKSFMVGRGCPFSCAFCHNYALLRIYKGKGDFVRYYSPQRVLQEIIQVKRKYSLKIVEFMDDTFISNKKWLLKFLPLYKEKIGLPFTCNIRGDLLDQELAKNLASAGCVSVFMGVESGNERLRTKILRKMVTDEQLKRAASFLHQYHIRLAANNMVGLPGESLDEAIQTVKFNTEIKVDLPWCAIFQPYPGSQLADYCLKKGYVRKKDFDKIGVSFLSRSILRTKDIKEIVNLQKLFHLGVWFPFLIPTIKILIKFPLTYLYDVIFLINQGLGHRRHLNLGVIDFFHHSWHFARFYYIRRRQT